ncbi:CHAP domain-containing protein [Oscillospiraceae bacterium CM]|nr:CHAP domain-containing protein [Oscillospiraceae bacterium CM]
MVSSQKLVDVARGYVGYLEKKSNAKLEDFTANAGSGNFTIFGQWYEMNGFAWCAMFVSYCAEKAGIPTSIIPKHASCAMGVSWFKHAGRWHDRKYTPAAGDIIYFTHDGETPAHVGIVTGVSGSKVMTIEGNTSGGSTLIANGGGVAAKSYPLSYEKILGYGSPAYEEEDMTYEQFCDYMDKYLSVAGTGDKPSAWAREATEAMKAKGVFNGDGQGNYGWQKPVTREALAVILSK